MSSKAIETEGLRLLKHPGIALGIARFRQVMAAGTELTFSQHMAELARLRDTAKARGQLSAAVRAEHMRGKLAGHYDRKEVGARNEFADMTDAELRDCILEALRALGIELTPTPRLITGPRKR